MRKPVFYVFYEFLQKVECTNDGPIDSDDKMSVDWKLMRLCLSNPL